MFKSDESFYDCWMRDLNLYSVPTPEENANLAYEYQEGNEYVLEEIINRNKLLIYDVAKRYTFNKTVLVDLFQVGEMALAYTARVYDARKGKFSTLAVTNIKRFFSDALAENNYGFKIPRNFYGKIMLYRKLTRNDDSLSDEELMCRLKVGKKALQMIKANENYLNIPSLNVTVNDDNSAELVDYVRDKDGEGFIKDIEEFKEHDLRVFLKSILNPYRYFIFCNRCLNEHTLTQAQVAKYFALDKQSISLIEIKVRKKIRDMIENGSFFHMFKDNCDPLIKTDPIYPDEIVDYLFVRDFLDDKEKELFKMLIFRDYNYSFGHYAECLEVSESDIVQYLTKILETVRKFKSSFDGKMYDVFREFVLKQEHSNIYYMDLEKKFDISELLGEFAEKKDLSNEETLLLDNYRQKRRSLVS